MPTTAPKPVSNYTPAPKGSQVARCYQFIQIGTVEEEYMGKLKKLNKIQLGFELPLKTKVWKEGEPAKPICVFKEFTLSMGDKSNLRKLVEGIIGTTLKDEEAFAFDVESLVGMPCILSITHKPTKKGNVRDEIVSASPLIEGMNCPDAFNKAKILTYSDWNQETFDSLPDFMKNKLMESEQFKNRQSTLTPEEKAKFLSQREKHNSNLIADKELDDISANDINF